MGKNSEKGECVDLVRNSELLLATDFFLTQVELIFLRCFLFALVSDYVLSIGGQHLFLKVAFIYLR